MPDEFETKIAPYILGKEGGYVNNKNDLGGETIWGITIATARRNGYNGAMRAMPKSTALRIYRKEFWEKPNYDLVAGISFLIARELFDTAVNMGTTRAGGYLQRALNAFNRNQKDYADITFDGKIGPVTVATLAKYMKKRGKQGEQVMLRALEAQQGTRYLDITEARKRNEEFTYGWFANRLEGRYGDA